MKTTNITLRLSEDDIKMIKMLQRHFQEKTYSKAIKKALCESIRRGEMTKQRVREDYFKTNGKTLHSTWDDLDENTKIMIEKKLLDDLAEWVDKNDI